MYFMSLPIFNTEKSLLMVKPTLVMKVSDAERHTLHQSIVSIPTLEPEVSHVER